MFQNVQLVPSDTWTPSACVTSIAEYTRLNSFINRSEGHNVVQLGEANENGFYRSFYINAPQSLDTAQGKMIIDKPLVDVTREYNAAFPVNLSNPAILGQIINVSLQPTISFKMSTETFTPLSVPAFS